MNSNPKVLHVIQRDTHVGGAPKVAVELAKAQRELGMHVSCLFLYGDTGFLSKDCEPAHRFCRYSGSREMLLNPRVYLDAVDEIAPNILHHHDMLPLPRLLQPFLKSTPHCVTHAHVDAGIRSFGFRTMIANQILKRTTDFWIMVSAASEATWLDEGVPKSRSQVIPNGVALKDIAGSAAPSRSDSDGKTILGLLGRLNIEHKGIDSFLEILSKLPDNYIGLIGGAGEDKKMIENLIEQLDLEGRVNMVGPVEDPAKFYSSIDILLFTSRFETFGLVPLEATVSGTPVISLATTGGARDLMSKYATLYIDSRSADKSAEAIRNFDVQDEWVKSKVKLAGSEIEANLSWDNAAMSTQEIYQKLMRGRV